MEQQSSVTQPEGTISLKEAMAYTTNWRTYIAPLAPNPNYIRAFYIPIVDITSLASFHNVEAVRAYIGLGTADDPATAKLILVPVADNGDDIIYAPSPDPIPQSAMYDFTQPCPATCDLNSPLFTGE